MKSVPRQLLIIGTIVLLLAALSTFFACDLGSNSMRRSTALFLERICPAGRMDGWTQVPAWHMFFSGLLWLWALGLISILTAAAMWVSTRRRPPGGVRGERESEVMPSMNPIFVGPDDLGEGPAMSDEQRRDFERQLRRSIEQRPLEETEERLRAAIDSLGSPLLLEAIRRAPGDIAIVGWESIAADMADARERLPPEHRHEPWRSVILALVYRNDYPDIFIRPSFALTAEMDRSVFERRTGLMSEEQHRVWLAANGDMATLPPYPHYRAYSRREPARLIGLEGLRAVEFWTAGTEAHSRLTPFIQTARMLAAGIVLLRFCQAAERYLARDALPANPIIFLTVDMAEWPMETNTVDYCIHAVRRVEAAVQDRL